jgi:hypothetical protein
MDELEETQLRKLKRRLIDLINKTDPDYLIRLAVLCKIHVPKQLKDKYL